MKLLLALLLLSSDAYAKPKKPKPAPVTPAAAAATTDPVLQLPDAYAGKVTVLTPDDPDYARAHIDDAIEPEGDGGISKGLVVELLTDVPVWRLWNGPLKKDSSGNTNRLGQWWAARAPAGTRDQYRIDYEVCVAWNDLTWVAGCTLKKGAVVAVGPGQSVSAQTCGDPSGQEAYPADPTHWQVFIYQPWTRMGTELDCPPETQDYMDDPNDISKPLLQP